MTGFSQRLYVREHHKSPSGSESFTLMKETGAVLLLLAAERNNCVYVELLSIKYPFILSVLSKFGTNEENNPVNRDGVSVC